ncbi:hypothetical protein FALBO_10238 [Fusarium albosuccineum]|uniref:Uncharacterized protein n=1 Tax=Fusarium albosuccineum TaxID=1237068 RepID=A0A8H4L867_9HYPO|nr:hypothetical protein FALBO_10238 [Fusarium albosuccineum]
MYGGSQPADHDLSSSLSIPKKSFVSIQQETNLLLLILTGWQLGGGPTQCATSIVTENVDICEAVTKALGDSTFVGHAQSYCTCLPDAVYYSTATFWKPMYDGYLVGDIHSNYINALYRTERCLTDDDVTVKTDRTAIIQSQLTAGSGWTVVRGPEIDLNTYKKLADALYPCRETTCDAAKLRAFFADYISNAESITDSEFTRMLNNWLTLFENLKKRVADVQKASRLVQARLNSVSKTVSSVKSRACQGTACKSSTVQGHFQKISAMMSTVKGLQYASTAADKAAGNLPKMSQVVKNSLTFTRTPADGAYYVGLVDNYQMTTLRDFTKAFRVTEYFPKAAEELKKSVSPFTDVSKYASKGRSGYTQIGSVLSVNWSRNQQLSKTVAGRRVRDGFLSIQKSVKNNLRTPVYDLIRAIDAMHRTMDQFPLQKKKLEWKVGAAPYSRWSEFNMVVPCAEEKTITMEAGGIESPPFTYTEIKKCELSQTKVSFPKQFIPYIKYRFV